MASFLFFLRRTQKRNFFAKFAHFYTETWIPVWLGFSAKPHCNHRTLTQSLLYTNELLPPLRLRYKRDGCAEEEKRWGCEKRKRERILKRGSDALLTRHTHEALSFPSRRSLPIWILFCRKVGYFHFSLVEQEYVRTKTDKILRSLFPRNQVSSVKVL